MGFVQNPFFSKNRNRNRKRDFLRLFFGANNTNIYIELQCNRYWNIEWDVL